MELSVKQNAMLERLANKYCYPHQCELGNGIVCHESDLLAALRELLLAVQERDAKIAEHFLGDLTAEEWPPCGLIQAKGRWDSGVSEKTATNISRAIRAQTYADLFLKEK